MQTYISQQAIKLKIKPENLYIGQKDDNNGNFGEWYVKIKYDRKRQSKEKKLNNLIKAESKRLEIFNRELEINNKLKGFSRKEKEIIIKQMLNIEKIISKNGLKIKIL